MSAPELHAIVVASADARWLSPAERRRYDALHIAKRRDEWLAGRMAAKELVRRRHGLPGGPGLAAVEIVAETEGPRRGQPRYRLGAVRPFGLSIGHAGGLAIAALATRRGESVGVDVDVVEARSPGFEDVLLAPAERAALAGVAGEARWRALTRLWVVKEAVAKALGTGLRVPLPALAVPDGDAIEVPPAWAAVAGRGGTVHVGRFGIAGLEGAWARISEAA